MLLQPPFRTLAVALPALAAAGLHSLPAICAAANPAGPIAACVRRGIVCMLLRAMAPPLVLAYTAELRARRVFVATVAPGGG